MTYSKPEVAILGNAFLLIEGSKPDSGSDPNPPTDTQAAYELDE